MVRRSSSIPGLALGTALLIVSVGSTAAQDNLVTLSTLDWSPYTGNELPKGGATTGVVRAAFEKAGYEIEVVYRPWKRAIDTANMGTDGVIAYFPGHYCRHNEGFVALEPIGYGPLGFAEHVDAPICWQSLDDIGEQRLEIGTMLGYANIDALKKANALLYELS